MDKRGNIMTKDQAISSYCEQLWKKLCNHQPLVIMHQMYKKKHETSLACN